jgi:hypothetical protein
MIAGCASADGPRRTQPPGLRRAVVLCLILIPVVVSATRIEVLNVRAAGVLPAKESYGGTNQPVPWRQSLCTDETRWCLMRGPRDESGQPLRRALTDDEKARMHRDIEEAVANNKLRDVVGTWGQLQYLLLPVSLALALSLLAGRNVGRSTRILGAGAMGVGAITGFLMVYRGYFTSMGW